MDNGDRYESEAIPAVVVRDYTPADHAAGRMLWVELTEHHRRLYDDPSIGGDDPGTGFDDYLGLAERAASWVADLDGRVVGRTGLLDHGTSGEIEPIVVTEDLRHRGVGRLEGQRLHGLEFRY